VGKHDYVMTKNEKAVASLVETLLEPRLATAYATMIVDAFAERDHFRRAYEAERAVNEKSAALLESLMTEISELRLACKREQVVQ